MNERTLSRRTCVGDCRRGRRAGVTMMMVEVMVTKGGHGSNQSAERG